MVVHLKDPVRLLSEDLSNLARIPTMEINPAKTVLILIDLLVEEAWEEVDFRTGTLRNE